MDEISCAGLLGLIQRKRQKLPNNNSIHSIYPSHWNNSSVPSKEVHDNDDKKKKLSSFKRRRRMKQKNGKIRLIISVLAMISCCFILLFLVADRPLMLFLRTFIYPIQSFAIDPVAPIDFQVVDLPDGMHDMLLTYLENYNSEIEEVKQPILYGNVKYARLNYKRQKLLIEAMRPVMEQFCNCELEQNSVANGIRLYQNGSSIIEHVDWPDSWVVSATVHVRNLNGKPWPITMRNAWQWSTGGEGTSFTHRPGQAVLYQGSRTWHKRQGPYDGEEYAAVFLGFLPKDYPKGTGWPTRFIVSALKTLKRYHLV